MTEHPLYEKIKPYMSESRFEHTLRVVKTARSLSKLCLSKMEDQLVIAAFLHDISKELPLEEQRRILDADGIVLDEDELDSPAIWHSYTAPHVIKRDFPEYADQNVLSAVRNHTVGDVLMTLFDEIIFLSDYIEEGRTYESCISLRKFVFDNMTDDCERNISVIHTACIKSIENTEASLKAKGKRVAPKSEAVKNVLKSRI